MGESHEKQIKQKYKDQLKRAVEKIREKTKSQMVLKIREAKMKEMTEQQERCNKRVQNTVQKIQAELQV